MPFRFSLRGLLRLREGLERNCELSFIAAQQRVSHLTQEIKSIDRTLCRWLDDQARAVKDGNTGADLHFRVACEKVLRVQREKLLQLLSEAETDRDAKAALYQEARRQREILDTLCEEEWQQYRKREKRREQQAADELFLLRRRAGHDTNCV